MKKFFSDFKAFVMRGNVVDLAVAVVIGGAFGAIITSLVDDIIMPVISLMTGGIKFTDWFVALDGKTYETLEAAQEAGASTLNYGSLISHIINFIIIAFSIFVCIKIIEKIRRKKEEEPEAPPEPTKEELLLTEIRDLLAEQNKEK